MLLAILMAQALSCAHPQTQADITQCAGEAQARADAALNAQWKLTLATMHKRDKDAAGDPPVDNQPSYADALLAAQRTWLAQNLTLGEKKSSKTFKATDQFGGELRYFSLCILENKDPEPDAEEGLADLRVLEGIQKAIESGAAVKLEPFQRHRRIDPDAQEQTLSLPHIPEPVDASSPSRSGS